MHVAKVDTVTPWRAIGLCGRIKIYPLTDGRVPARLPRVKREPAIVGNNRIDSIAAPTIAAATSGVIDSALTPVWVITTMMVSDGTADESAKGQQLHGV